MRKIWYLPLPRCQRSLVVIRLFWSKWMEFLIWIMYACERTRLSLVDDIFQITNSNIVIGMPRRCISSDIGIAWGADTRFQPNCNCAVKIKWMHPISQNISQKNKIGHNYLSQNQTLNKRPSVRYAPAISLNFTGLHATCKVQESNRAASCYSVHYTRHTRSLCGAKQKRTEVKTSRHAKGEMRNDKNTTCPHTQYDAAQPAKHTNE